MTNPASWGRECPSYEAATAFWIGTTADHSHAISGQYRFSLVDFASETMVAQLQGINQSFGYTPPTLDRVVAYDPLRSESLFFYDVSTPSSPQYLGETPAVGSGSRDHLIRPPQMIHS